MSHEAPRSLWQQAHQVPLPALGAGASADACVVGLGGSGLEAIHELLDLGLSVIGLDAQGVAAGAAGRNGGFLLAGTAAFHHDAVRRLGRETAVAIHRATASRIAQMVAEHPASVRRTGSLRIAADDAEHGDCQRQLEAMRADSLPVEWYDGPEGAGLLFPSDAAFDPARRCAELAATAMRRGAALYAPAPATVDHGHAGVRVGDIRVHAPIVIVTIDGGLGKVLPELEGVVRTARLQMIATGPGVRRIATRPVYFRHGYEYWQQLDDGTVVLGGFRDLAGESEWTDSAAPASPVQDLLETFLRERLGVTEPVARRWAASVGYRTALLPYVGEVRPGVWAAGGYNGTGNVIGAIAGRALARWAVTGDRSGLPWDPVHAEPAHRPTPRAQDGS